MRNIGQSGFRIVMGCIAALGLATSMACSGGGGDSTSGDLVPGGNSGGASSTLAGSFVTDDPLPAAMSVSVAEVSSTANLITVAIQATDASDVFTAGFDVDYDPSRVEYVSWAPGTLLEAGGESVIYNVSPQAGTVVVGLSRAAPAAGANAVGSQALIRLTFRVSTAGSSALVLSDGFLLDSQPPGPSEIPGISWSGGQILAN